MKETNKSPTEYQWVNCSWETQETWGFFDQVSCDFYFWYLIPNILGKKIYY